MPRLAPRPCGIPGCPDMIEKNGYCLVHLDRVKKARSRDPRHKRASRQKRGYDDSHFELRKMVRARQPICATPGCDEPGVELHHKDGNQWNREDSNLVMLCKPHHAEISYRQHGGAGYKIDFHPSGLPRPAIPVKVICGPPGSGKTRYVKRHAAKGDVVIDLDEIRARLSGLPWYKGGEEWLRPSIAERNRMIRELAQAASGAVAWLIVSGQRVSDRRYWREALGAEVIVLETPPEVCVERIGKDPRRAARRGEYEGLVDRWWAGYVSDVGDVKLRPR